MEVRKEKLDATVLPYSPCGSLPESLGRGCYCIAVLAQLRSHTNLNEQDECCCLLLRQPWL